MDTFAVASLELAQVSIDWGDLVTALGLATLLAAGGAILTVHRHVANEGLHVTPDEKRAIAESKVRDEHLKDLYHLLFRRLDGFEIEMRSQREAMQQLNREASGARGELRDAIRALHGGQPPPPAQDGQTENERT